jgi:hypothetical protein
MTIPTISFKDFATAYEPPKTKNIADLPEVSIEIPIEQKMKENDDGEEYTYFAITVEKQEYRVPASVVGQVKLILETKQGTGLNTRYQVVPLE